MSDFSSKESIENFQFYDMKKLEIYLKKENNYLNLRPVLKFCTATNGASELIIDFCPNFNWVYFEDKSDRNFNTFIFPSESRSIKFSCSIAACFAEICDFNFSKLVIVTINSSKSQNLTTNLLLFYLIFSVIKISFY